MSQGLPTVSELRGLSKDSRYQQKNDKDDDSSDDDEKMVICDTALKSQEKGW